MNSKDLFENLHLAFFVIVEKLENDFTMTQKSPAKGIVDLSIYLRVIEDNKVILVNKFRRDQWEVR